MKNLLVFALLLIALYSCTNHASNTETKTDTIYIDSVPAVDTVVVDTIVVDSVK